MDGVVSSLECVLSSLSSSMRRSGALLLAPALLLGACGGGGAELGEPIEPPEGWEAVDGVTQTTASEVMTRGAQGLYVAAGRSVYLSANGEDWTALVPLPADVEAASLIEIDGQPWAGGYNNAGVYRLPVGATAWREDASGLAGLGARTVLGLAVRGRQLFAATAGSGLYRRELDQAAGWVADRQGIPSNLSWNVESVAEHQGRVIAGAGGNGNLYIRTADSLTWREVGYETFNGEALFLWSFFDDGDALLAAGNRRLYRSTDAGETWTVVFGYPRYVSRARFAATDTAIYVMLTTSIDTRILRSTDGGLSWNPAVENLQGVQGYDIGILQSTLFLAHQNGFWRTTLQP